MDNIRIDKSSKIIGRVRFGKDVILPKELLLDRIRTL